MQYTRRKVKTTAGAKKKNNKERMIYFCQVFVFIKGCYGGVTWRSSEQHLWLFIPALHQRYYIGIPEGRFRRARRRRQKKCGCFYPSFFHVLFKAVTWKSNDRISFSCAIHRKTGHKKPPPQAFIFYNKIIKVAQKKRIRKKHMPFKTEGFHIFSRRRSISREV